MDNYLTRPKFHNTGFIPMKVITEMRSRQGLQPQDISNACIQYLDKNDRRLYPITLTPLPTYNLPPISDENPCTWYIQAP